MSGPCPVIECLAPAKINLTLKVYRRRSDGYHEIESLMQKLELADRLRLQRVPQKGIVLRCTGADLPSGAENLAYRAAQAFLDFTGARTGVEIDLEKRIPVAAGLGGGSSDAGAVITGLNDLLAAGLSSSDMQLLARPLGADVPFFVADYPAAWATGIGDQLRPAPPLRKRWIILVNPGFPVSTRWAYENLALTSNGNPFIVAPNRESGSCFPATGSETELLCNDLEMVTIQQYPVLRDIKSALLARGASGVLMSGSGPTVFGLFTEKRQAEHCLTELCPDFGDKVFLTRPMRAQ